MNFWWTVLATATGNALAFLLYQGFVKSYWGQNIREEITRWFNKLSKHWKKEQQNEKTN